MNQTPTINGMTHWQAWDAQEARRIKRLTQDAAYIELNNLYLAIERGIARCSVYNANKLRCLVSQAYDQTDPMRDYWAAEFVKLPRWNDV